MLKKTAILVDGSFFLKRYKAIYRPKTLQPDKIADAMYEMCFRHITKAKHEEFDLYRIFYYDCLPYSKKHHNPISGAAIDFAKTEQYKFRNEFYAELKKKRKIALRL